MEFSIYNKTYYRKLKTSSIQVFKDGQFYRIRVATISSVNIYAASMDNKLHCGVVFFNNFRIGKTKNFKYCLMHLIPSDKSSVLNIRFENDIKKLEEILKTYAKWGALRVYNQYLFSSGLFYTEKGFEVLETLVQLVCNKNFNTSTESMCNRYMKCTYRYPLHFNLFSIF